MAIKLVSTDFDGTLFAEFENPPVPLALQEMLKKLQDSGAKWVINTGRDLPGVLETLGRAKLCVQPDYIVIVERAIYRRQMAEYVEHEPWNRACTAAHEELFRRVRPDVPRLRAWVEERFKATLYEDPYSPFCFIAGCNGDADVIHKYLVEYSQTIPGLNVVRNDVYARFCHEKFNKGTALAEIASQLSVKPEETFAAGDHLNDLPMLTRKHAHFLAAPSNAIEVVKQAVRDQQGHVSKHHCGHGVADALCTFLGRNGAHL